MPTWRSEQIKYYDIDHEDFDPFYGKTFKIPPGAVFWRSKYPIVSSSPAYYYNKEYSKKYAQNTGKLLSPFTNTKELNLVDIRFMKVFLKKLFEDYKTIEGVITKEDEQLIMTTTASLGLCSLGHQIKLLKRIYKNNLSKLKGLSELEKLYDPESTFEMQGVRIGEISLDVYTLGFLKELFYKAVDGFVVSQLDSPLLIENGGTLNPEIIIFDPEESGIRYVPEIHEYTDLSPNSITCITFGNHYHEVLARHIETPNPFNLNLSVVYNHPLDEFHNYMNSENSPIKKVYENALKGGERWRRKMFIYLAEPPRPCVPISIFQDRKPLEIG